MFYVAYSNCCYEVWASCLGAVEYTDCISVEVKDSLNECPVNDTK